MSRAAPRARSIVCYDPRAFGGTFEEDPAVDITLQEVVVWGVLGLLAGSLAGALINQKKEGFGMVTNLVFGLIGAFIGGALFDFLKIDTGLGSITINLNHLVAAFVGAILVVVGAKIVEGQRSKKKD